MMSISSSWLLLSLVLTYVVSIFGVDWSRLINLPDNHIPRHINNNPQLLKRCLEDTSCPSKKTRFKGLCWGHEPGCKRSDRYGNPDCSGDHKHWVHTKSEQGEKFWRTADFGIVSERLKELHTYCQPETQEDSKLECTEFLRYCRATNLFLDLTSGEITGSNNRDRYREDILGPGLVGGHCRLDQSSLRAQGQHKSPLQSWFAELQHYSSLKFYPSKGDNCDVVIEKPTYLMKLDAGVNMYHHFCDFVNLYTSQHINNSFSTDVNIIMWDTTKLPYGDLFSATWQAFTDHPIIPLRDLDGKKVCIKDAVFPLLPRMRYGLYYNMPLIPGCTGSTLMKAFSEHILHRLHIPQTGPNPQKLRVTLLSRNTQYRNILNQEELVKAMTSDGELEVNLVNYNSRKMSFEAQLQSTHNSDIFIGIHGAGLTHLLFLPDWAVVMEIYNCDDPGCYSDLARLRGIKYITWEKKDKLTQEDEGHHPTLGAHAKFTNYAFDVVEFMRLLHKGMDHVRQHPQFVEARTKQILNADRKIKEEL